MSQLFSAWEGPVRTEEEVLDPWQARAMLALLDRDPDELGEGDWLPPGWHWLYFRPLAPRSRLAPDGHERRGAFLPPVALPRRMWAGGRLRFPGDLRIGDRAERTSRVASVSEKEGRSGPLVFVTVRHEVRTARGPAVEEDQVLVYLERGSRDPPPEGSPEPGEAAWSEPYSADPVTLFRFSALTFNGHRIHYDHPYATAEEGYPGLVVHGPLLALLLLDLGIRRGGAPPSTFRYRGVAPLFADEPFRLAGRPGEGLELWARHSERGVAMLARMEPRP